MCWFCSQLDALFINLHMLREILDQSDFHSMPAASELVPPVWKDVAVGNKTSLSKYVCGCVCVCISILICSKLVELGPCFFCKEVETLCVPESIPESWNMTRAMTSEPGFTAIKDINDRERRKTSTLLATSYWEETSRAFVCTWEEKQKEGSDLQ